MDNAYKHLLQYTWTAVVRGPGGSRTIAIRPKPGRRGPAIMMHREVMRPRKDQVVKHRNGNRLDNRRENLYLQPRPAGKVRTAGKIREANWVGTI